MTDVFEEVEEEVRRDRWKRLLSRFGPCLVGAFALALVGIAGWRFYEGWSVQQSRAEAGEFARAQKLLADGDAKNAAAAFAAMSSRGPVIYRDMAAMQRAAALADQGDLEGAVRGFDAAAASAKDPIVRDMSRLRAAYIVADTQDFAAVRARVQPLIDAGGPISYSARELLGVEAWEAGQFDLARRTFQSLSDAFQTPESVRQRAQLALAVLGPGPPGAEGSAGGEPKAAPPRAQGGATK